MIVMNFILRQPSIQKSQGGCLLVRDSLMRGMHSPLLKASSISRSVTALNNSGTQTGSRINDMMLKRCRRQEKC